MADNNYPNIDPALTQEAAAKKAKVYLKYNPYFTNDTQADITSIEQIYFYHKKIKGSRILGEFLKDNKVKPRIKKRAIKDIMKFWEKEFREKTDEQKQIMLEKTAKLKRKRIKKIRAFFIYLFGFICVVSILMSQRLTYLNHAPYINKYVSEFYSMIETPLYNNLLIVLIYLSLISALFLILLRTYFDYTKKIGINAEGFVKEEFKKMDKSFVYQQGHIRAHLFKDMHKRFKKPYQIVKIYDPKVVIDKLDNYGKYVEKKVARFRKYYYWLLLLAFLLDISVLCLTGYIGYTYYITYIKIG